MSRLRVYYWHIMLIRTTALLACLAIGSATPSLGEGDSQKEAYRSSIQSQSVQQQGGECALPALHCLLIATANGSYDPYHGKGPARQGETWGALVIQSTQRSRVPDYYWPTTPWRSRQSRRYLTHLAMPLGNEKRLPSTTTQTLVIQDSRRDPGRQDAYRRVERD